ncbi:trypsin-like serine peptidase [Sphaerisporangium dianthi]|uniref:Peptidase S1 domain-containing protein n=1 Tax=Sphaerisporangium dianthi TaxID=1436120 RepID=A0ABV9CAR6_9ACTN
MTPILPLIAAASLVTGPAGAAPADRQVSPARVIHTDAAEAAGQAASAGVVQHVAALTGAEQRRVLTYWTPRRMARALPGGLLGAVAKIGRLGSGALPLRVAGARPPGHGRPAAPSRPTPPSHPADPPRERPAGEGPPARGGAPGVPGAPSSSAAGARTPTVNTSAARWSAGGAVTRTTGRVFLTMRGVDYVCSAGAIRSRNMDVVLTAGHCVKDGKGAWAENWTFVPGYESGSRPYGVFTARRMLVPEPWSRKGDDSSDLGMVAVNPSGDRHLGQIVGGQEIGFGVRRGGRAFGFGFPADPPYDGEHLIYCSGATHADPHGQTRDQGMRCDLTAGSSGGPWLSSFDPATGQGVVTSVSSFKYSDDAGTMYGPYFGDQARRLFEAAQRA